MRVLQDYVGGNVALQVLLGNPPPYHVLHSNFNKKSSSFKHVFTCTRVYTIVCTHLYLS